MAERTRWLILLTLLPLAVVTGGAALAAHVSSMAFWPALAIGVAAVLLNGVLAALEDKLPGGFGYRAGVTTPSMRRWHRVGRWTLVVLCVVLAGTVIGLRFVAAR